MGEVRIRSKTKDYNGITQIPHAPDRCCAFLLNANQWPCNVPDVLGCGEVNDILRRLFGGLVELGCALAELIPAAVLKEWKDECRK
jgi:hypothetical protein